MTIAALILATLSLVVSVGLCALVIGKEFFSSHKIQYVPMDSPFGFGPGEKASSPLADIEEPLPDDE